MTNQSSHLDNLTNQSKPAGMALTAGVVLGEGAFVFKLIELSQAFEPHAVQLPK